MITVFRRQRLPACRPVLVPPLQEPGQNTETEYLLLPALHECYLPACVPVRWFFVTLWTVAPQAPMSMGFPGKNTAVVPFATPGDLTRPETRLKCPECVALQAYFLLLSHPDNVYTSP